MSNALRELRETAGWTQEEAARQIGISYGSYVKLERGERGLRDSTLSRAAEVFGVSVDVVMGKSRKPSTGPATFGRRDLPVYASSVAGLGAGLVGEMVLKVRRPIDRVVRPWFLQEVREAWGLIVSTDAMSPVYEIGDLAIIHPHLPFARGKDTLFLRKDVSPDEVALWGEPEQEGGDGGTRNPEARVRIGRLVNWDDQFWFLQRFDTPAARRRSGDTEDPHKLTRETWPQALRVVSKYSP